MSFRKDINKHLFDNRYFYLLAATMLQVFLVSFFPNRNNLFINEFTFSLFMMANINFIRHNRKLIALFIFFALVAIVLAWIPTQSDIGQIIFAAERGLVVALISVIIYLIIYSIVKTREVNANMILGVITIYILFGMLAGEANQIIHHFDPKAFTGSINPGDPADLRYYSFVTMTTLGYGDIAPVSRLARASAVFFSLVGQIYLAVVIALIVGKYVSASDKKEFRDQEPS